MNILRFAIFVISSLLSIQYSMDHPDVRAAGSNPSSLRQIANEKARALDLAAPVVAHHAIPTHLPPALNEVLKTVAAPLQPYVTYAVTQAIARITADLGTIVVGPDNLFLSGNATVGGGAVAGTTGMFGNNAGGHTGTINSPANRNRDAFIVGLTAALNDHNTTAELAHHNPDIADIGANPSLSSMRAAIAGIHQVLCAKVRAYLIGLDAANRRMTHNGGLANSGGSLTRDQLITRLQDAVNDY